jgi:outer membrane lipoprotein-sorting protein
MIDMTRRPLLTAALLVAALLAMEPSRAEPTALEILDRADDKIDIQASQVELEMLVYRDNELRKTYRMLLKYADADHTLAETTYPPRNQGEKMLQAGRRNYWLFLPNINKSVRISESNSFSNGDFSNADILSPRLSSEYTPRLLGVEALNNEEAYKLELTAKDEEAAYARILYWIRRADFVPLRRDYYTFSQQLLKRLDLRQMSAVMPKGSPDALMMTSVLERDKKTVIRYLKYTPHSSFPSGTFDENALMRR